MKKYFFKILLTLALVPGLVYGYTIQSGDTLSSIARNFDTSVSELVDINQISNPDLIYAGDDLIIPTEFASGDDKLSDEEIKSWIEKIENGEITTNEQVNLVPEEVWYKITPTVVKVTKKDGGLLGGNSENIIDQFICRGDECNQYVDKKGDLLGFSVVSRYKTTLESSMTSSQTTIPVSSITTFDGHVLTMSDLGDAVYLTVEPGSSREEIIKCTSIASSYWATCTRGLAFYGSTETSVSANQKAHNAGAIVVMSNVHYVYENLVDKDADETINGVKTYTSFPEIATSTALCTTNGQLCNKYYIDTVGAGGFTSVNASTTRGLEVYGTSPETVGINASSTTGMGFDGNGALYQAIGNALEYTGNTIAVSTSTIVDQIATSTATADTIVMASSTGKIAPGWLGGTATGDIFYSDGTSFQPLGIGSAGQVLKTNSGGTAPTWGGLSYRLTTDTTQRTTNSTNALTVASVTLPGGILNGGGYIKAKIFISDLDAANSSDAYAFYLKIGTTTVASVTDTGKTPSNETGVVDLSFIAPTNSSQIGGGTMVLKASGSAMYSSAGFNTASVDISGDTTLTVVAQITNKVSASPQITVDATLIEVTLP